MNVLLLVYSCCRIYLNEDMHKLSLIILFILFRAVYTRRIGRIVNQTFTYEPSSTNTAFVRRMEFDRTSSCNVCICAALLSTINYIAIQCFQDTNSCSLLTSLVNITGLISSPNSLSYILSSSLDHSQNSTSLSSTTSTTACNWLLGLPCI